MDEAEEPVSGGGEFRLGRAFPAACEGLAGPVRGVIPAQISADRQASAETRDRASAWVTRRWLLRGDPGSGKTTLLRHLAAKLAETGGEPWVPVFASLPPLMRAKGWWFDRIAEDLDTAGQPGAAIRQALEGCANEGRLLLLLDGLDEVPRELRERTEGFLGNLVQRWPKSPLVVSTRPIGG